MKAVILCIGIILQIIHPIFAAEKLIFAIDVIRHGDRTALQQLPKAHHQWREGLGQLTSKGIAQEFKLGRKFRKQYIEISHLLPKQYDPKTLYARSTDYDRTLMSAETVLYGMYTSPKNQSINGLPFGFQPIPVHTKPQEDKWFAPNITLQVNKDLLDTYVFTQKDWQLKESQLKPKLARWSHLTGRKIENLMDLQEVSDSFIVFKHHGIPYPAGFSKNEAQEIMDAGNWIYASLFKPHMIGKIFSKELVIFLKNSIINATKPSDLKFLLVSAHDSTILAVMSALQIPLDVSPPYASDLNFLVYKINDKDFIVRISYNGKFIHPPGCNPNGCTLQQFLSLT